MKRKLYHAAFPVALVVAMGAFLSTFFFANAHLSFAASGKTKSSAVAMTSAVDHTEARIKELQGALKITPDQEELWNNLTQVMRENAKEMDALTKDRRENSKTMNAVENIARVLRLFTPERAVPTIDVDGEVFVGFNEDKLTLAINRAARRRM